MKSLQQNYYQDLIKTTLGHTTLLKLLMFIIVTEWCTPWSSLASSYSSTMVCSESHHTQPLPQLLSELRHLLSASQTQLASFAFKKAFPLVVPLPQIFPFRTLASFSSRHSWLSLSSRGLSQSQWKLFQKKKKEKKIPFQPLLINWFCYEYSDSLISVLLVNVFVCVFLLSLNKVWSCSKLCFLPGS